jgi:hypothetical protein
MPLQYAEKINRAAKRTDRILRAELGVMDADGFHKPGCVINIREELTLDSAGSTGA